MPFIWLTFCAFFGL